MRKQVQRGPAACQKCTAERRSMPLKPPSFAPDSTPGQGGDQEVGGSPIPRAPAVTPHPFGSPRRSPAHPNRLPDSGGTALRGCAVKAWGGPPGRPGIWKVSPPLFCSRSRFSFATRQHGARAADPGVFLRRAVPLLLAGLRGDAGSGRARAERRESAGRRAHGLVRFLALPKTV